MNFLAIAMMIIIYIAGNISPQKHWYVAFPGLIYPLVLMINAGFVIVWIIFRKYYFMFSLITIFLGYSYVQSFVQFSNISKPLPEKGENISLLSYNVKVFDIYNYGPKWELNFDQRNNIFRFLGENNFDIVCFQEFVHDKTGKFKTMDTLPTLMAAQNAHTGFTRSSRDINFFGLATFTRFPIIHQGQIDFPTQMGNLCIYTDMVTLTDTIRVYNVHFESIGLSPEDYMFVESMASRDRLDDREYLWQGGIRILKRLKDAFRQRARQVDIVKRHMLSSPYPVILAGDFNDTPASYTYRTLTHELKDAFLSGRGIGQTYIGAFPGFRIDYILHSQEFKALNFTTGPQKYSDHHPIWVWLNLGAP